MTSTPKPDTDRTSRSWLLRHIRLTLAAAILILLLLLLFGPSFIAIGGYKNHITQLVASSLGRPVRLSSVELRLLPRPGFVLTDLTVQEDPAYGAEPVLHANTVVASIRLLSLLGGRLALDRISVDEASLNLVRRADGHWNADSLFRTAAPASTAAPSVRRQLPYMEASNSRINIKLGSGSSLEKLPFSLTNTDAALWHEDDGWHIRLRGQPTRTDIPLDQADTGIVRLEATFRPASQLSQMPLHIDMEWREAQLGQLSRLILGSDEDWRGDLTGELHADGSADAAQITTRLRATGVHRVEFAPAAALDFDANCAFRYNYSARSLEKIQCDSPVGNGRLRLTGNLPSETDNRQLTLELDRVPAQAPLDLLRTLRGNLDQSITVAGTLSGKMTYSPSSASPLGAPSMMRSHRTMGGKALPPASAIQGSFAGQGIRISGDGLSIPVEIAKLLIEPAPAEPSQPPALAASFSVPTRASAPLTVTAELAQSGFDIAVRGTAFIPRLRELAHTAGIPQVDALSQLSGDPATLNLRIQGIWLAPAAPDLDPASDQAAKKISGSIALHNAVWKPDFLASPLDLTQATMHLENGLALWDGVTFAYGPTTGRIQGTATFETPLPCNSERPCVPEFTVHLAALDSASLQLALLGAREPGTESETLLSSLLNRFRPVSQPMWPAVEGTIQADTFTAGPFTFTGASAHLRMEAASAHLTALEARALGGAVRGTASIKAPAGESGKPQYTLDASFTGIKPQEAARLIGANWSGGPILGTLKLDLNGFTASDLTTSASGTLNFDWRNGRMGQAVNFPLLATFARWNGKVKIEKSALTLGENKIHRNGRTASATGSLTLGPEPKLTLTTPSR